MEEMEEFVYQRELKCSGWLTSLTFCDYINKYIPQTNKYLKSQEMISD